MLTGLSALSGVAQWVAFNDFAPGMFTHPNATASGLSGGVVLKNITNGQNVAATVTVTSSGAAAGNVQGVPNHGTPASIVFDDYVDFSGRPAPGIEIDTATDFITYTFSGLDPNAEYNFQGTAMRGNAGYADRWSLFDITNAVSFTSRHSVGALTTAQVPALKASQVALNTGNNANGLLAWWENIRPSASGTFAVICTQYKGTVPGGTSAGTKGYGITGFRLEKTGVYTGRTNVPPRVVETDAHHFNGIKTVFLILMENHDWSTIIGAAECPYINGTLLPMSSYCDNYNSPHGNHPSEPNYLWLVAGTNFGIRDDLPPANNRQASTSTLFKQMDAAGVSWKVYAENISGTDCPTVDVNPYGVRHNPAVFFDSTLNDFNYCTNHNRPFTQLATDLANNNAPRFCFIVPNVTNDMHDLAAGSASTRTQGDNWLAREVPKILNSAAYSNGGALIITWDEGSSETDGPIGTIILSPRVRGGGYHNGIYYTHSSTLRTVQDIFGLRPYLGDAAYARNLSDLFKTVQIRSPRWLTNRLAFSVTNTIAGKTNYVQLSTNLTSTNWVTIQTNVASGNNITITNAAGATNHFFRVIEAP